ncbi:hypothetical protein TNCV_2324441 [Trichonephila clavipes]|nr:hypothetical protein TNCV_2324441 [Trichonephila clavipes]
MWQEDDISPLNFTIKMVASRRCPVIKIRTWDSNAKRFDLVQAIPKKTKELSEIRIQIIVPHPKLHLLPTFGALALASSVPEDSRFPDVDAIGDYFWLPGTGKIIRRKGALGSSDIT